MWCFKSQMMVLLCASVLSACTFVDVRQSVSYDHGQGPIPETTINGIRPEVTTRDWLLDHIGEPDVVVPGKEGDEVLTYRFTEQQAKRVRVFLLFRYQQKSLQERHLFVHLNPQGQVTKYWRDYEPPAVPADELDKDPQIMQQRQLELHKRQHDSLDTMSKDDTGPNPVEIQSLEKG